MQGASGQNDNADLTKSMTYKYGERYAVIADLSVLYLFTCLWFTFRVKLRMCTVLTLNAKLLRTVTYNNNGLDNMY